jgi:spore coat protein CotH
MTTTRRRLVASIVFAAALVWGDTTPVDAQTADDLFNDQVLHDVRLFVHSRDLEVLRTRYLENIYVPADLVWRGIRVRNVGIRSRGGGSRNQNKLGLRVDFNRYARRQRFLGLTALVLDNGYQDASLMRESLAMSVYRRMGMAAPRESFARLYINNQYQGVYILVEPIDQAFLSRTIGEDSGHLFEYQWVIPFYTEYLGDNPATYRPLFQPATHELESDSTLYGPIRDLFREVNEPDEGAWREHVEARLDLGQFMTHTAVQGCLAQVDGILGYAGLNNFYAYRFDGADRHRLFPWDEDFAFAFGESSLLRQGEQPVVLFDRAFAEPDLRALFLDVAADCARVVAEEGWLLAEVERRFELIGPAVFEDTHKPYTYDSFLGEVDFLRTFAVTRSALVLDEVARLR